VLRLLLGLPNEREMPRFATRTFQRWARSRKVSVPQASNSQNSTTIAHKRKVILWPDTFTNHFHPGIGQAALEVLEGAGFEVTVPQLPLCCGRSLYDFGMLDRAKKYLVRIMQLLGAEIDSGLPIVVLEPSCASVFRDELRGLFPREARAARVRQQP